MTEDDLTDDRIVVPRKRVQARRMIGGGEAEWVVESQANMHRAFTEARHMIEGEARKSRTLLAGKPTIRITVEIEWTGFAFPEDAQDIYEAERVGQALGMEVDSKIDHLVIQRAPRLLP